MTDLKSREKCLVCSMAVGTEIKSEYKGHTYYFCTESDKKTFLGNPEKYVGKAARAA